MALQFTNEETAAKYDALVNSDHWMYVPNLPGKGSCYKGFLSEITPAFAERYIELGGNKIARKDADNGVVPEVIDDSASY